MKRRSVPAVALSVLTVTLLAGCGGPKPAPGPLVPEAPSTAPVSTKLLNSTTLKSFSGALVPQLQGVVNQLADGAARGGGLFMPFTAGVGGGAPLAKSGLLGAQGIEVQPAECTAVSGDLTDADEDSVPVNGVFSVDCTDSGEGYSARLTGRDNARDRDDRDPRSGFIADSRYDGKLTSEDSTGSFELTFGLGSLLNVETPAAGKVQAAYALNWNAVGTFSLAGQSRSVGSQVVLGMDLNRTPDADGRGAQVAFSGQASVKDDLQQLDGAATFSGDLHYSDGANGCDGVDRGSVTFTSGGVSTTVTYTGCNTYQ